MDPLFASRFRSLTVMGASVYARGNASMATEFNAFCDPEGAFVALQHFPSAKLPVVIVPWEATETHALTWQEFDQLCAGHEEHIHGDPITRHLLEASFLKKTHAKYELVSRKGHKEELAKKARANANNQSPSKRSKSNSDAAAGSLVTADQADAFDELPSLPELSAAAASATAVSGAAAVGVQAYQEDISPGDYVCCDSYAVAAFLRPDVISSSVTHYAEIMLQGTADVRGMLAIDWYDRKKVDKSKWITIVTGFHRAKYLQMMKDIFQPHTPTTNANSNK
jgi:inosine-uridine nucleoside N-ribohydrolase